LDSGKDPSWWPLAVLGTLLFALLPSKRDQSSESVHPQDSTGNKDADAKKYTTLGANVIPTPPNSGNADGSKHKTPLWEKLAVIAAFGLLLVNICQMRSTEKAAKATKESADLTRHTLEGADTAKFSISGIDRIDGDYWRLRLGNFGKVAAPTLQAHYAVTHIASPSGQLLDTPEESSFTRSEILPRGEKGDNDVVHDFHALGLREHSSEIAKGIESYKIDVFLSYNNGFDRIVSDHLCWEVVPPVINQNGTVSLNIYWDDCEQVPAQLAKARGNK
jgi:hypothetical protein